MINKFINKGEKITLIIENVKEEFLPAFRGLAKSIYAKIKTNKTRQEIITQMEKESKELNEKYKKGELKTFKSMKEYKEFRKIK